MTPDELLQSLWHERATAIIRTDDQEVAAEAMRAAVRGGFKFVEFTRGCPGVYELIEEFARDSSLCVGIGTALKAKHARLAVKAGARFVVSPVTDPKVIGAALDLGAVAMPGGYTATELHRARREGAQLQKLFPNPVNGPEYVRLLLGPLPKLRIVPTAGVTPDNVGDWLAAGAYAVGFVGSLFDRDLLGRRDYEAIEQRARQSLEAARAASRPASCQPPRLLEAIGVEAGS